MRMRPWSCTTRGRKDGSQEPGTGDVANPRNHIAEADESIIARQTQSGSTPRSFPPATQQRLQRSDRSRRSRSNRFPSPRHRRADEGFISDRRERGPIIRGSRQRDRSSIDRNRSRRLALGAILAIGPLRLIGWCLMPGTTRGDRRPRGGQRCFKPTTIGGTGMFMIDKLTTALTAQHAGDQRRGEQVSDHPAAHQHAPHGCHDLPCPSERIDVGQRIALYLRTTLWLGR